MTHIAPLPLEEITDPEMLELIAQGNALGVPDDLFPRLLARSPAQAKPVLRAFLMSHTQGNVDHKLKEIVRILLARLANDKYFASLRRTKPRRWASPKHGSARASPNTKMMQRALARRRNARCALPI